MSREFLRTLLTPNVRAAQAQYHDREYPELGDSRGSEALGDDEIAFVQQRDSFYLATITANGWPYVQHRGGPVGFLVASSPRELLFADYGGNRQLISVGSLSEQDRVCLFLMDYPARTRLKILGTAEVLDVREEPDLAAAATPPGGHGAPVERVIRIAVHAFDWNCPKFITPRFTLAEVDAVTKPLQERIAALQTELDALRRTT